MLVFAAEFGTQTSHVNIHGSRAAVVVVPPHFLQQLRAGEHASGVLNQIFEQFEFFVGQINRVPVQTCRISIGVDDQVAATDQPVGVLCPDRI